MSNVEFELLFLAVHMSSLGPGVSGVSRHQSARNKLTSTFWNNVTRIKLLFLTKSCMCQLNAISCFTKRYN